MLTAAPASASVPPDDGDVAGGNDRWRRYIENAIFAFLVYVPILLMAPGKVESDTKSYLYLDPGRLLDRATSLWDPAVGMGGLSHQTIGYLFPMGPYYWTMEAIGVPDWIAQRLWLGTIIFLAGLGVRYMLRTFGVRGPGVAVAMVVYAFTPYVLGNSPQYTTLLGPWAAMPWWIAFMALALRRGGWKYPALFAIGVQLTAALNGTALIYGLIAPAMWLLFALFVTRESTLRRTWTVVWRTALLTAVTSLWWVVSLSVEGEYGLNLLRFTESIRVVSIATLPSEILRGLGNWYFYGGDRNGLWSDARPYYTQRFWLIFISLLIPALALLAAAVMRWKYKAYFVLLILVGLAISVGPSPYDDPSILGGAYKEFALGSAFGFALRNTVRAVPMVALGLAVLLGAGVSSLVASTRTTRWRPYAYFAAGLVLVLCLINAIPALGGNYYNKALQRDSEIPQYWKDTVKYLDSQGTETRVLALPGTPFATHRWGDMKDALEPGLMDRTYVDRELVPAGSEPAANLVQSLDERLQDQSLELAAVAPVARLMGVGDVELRMDLQTDQYALIPAGELWKSFTEPVPAGLGKPLIFGTTIPGRLKFPDPGDLAIPDAPKSDPPPVAVLPVEDPLPIIRAKSEAAPLIIDGDGVGLVDTASAGLLDAQRLVLYSAPFEQDPKRLRDLGQDATLVVTDSNRRRGTRWAAMTDNYGYTEQAGEEALVLDPLDQRLEPFTETTDASRTVTILSGVKSVRATTYGSPSYNYAPDTRPSQALDGNLDTAWLIDPGVKVERERLRIELDQPITTDHINFVQLSSLLGPSAPPDPRYINKVGLTFDDGDTVQRVLGAKSRKKAGQDVQFPRRTFSTLEVQVDGVYRNERGGGARQRNAVGFNEVRLTDEGAEAPVRLVETQQLPTDLLDAFGKDSAAHPLALVLTRENTMDATQLSRTFSLPTAREFTFSGTASLSALATDPAIDRSLGLPDVASGGISTSSNRRHHLGTPTARTSFAIDGDPGTAWVSPIVKVQPTLHLELAEPITFDHLDLQVIADGRHSVPSQLTITSDDGSQRVVDLLGVSTAARPGGVLSLPVQFEALTGKSFTIAVTRAQQLKRAADSRPVGIAELGIPGVRRAPLAPNLAGECTEDLVEVDGKPFPVRVTGTTDDALQQHALTLAPCDASASLALAAGSHQIRARMSPHNPTGFDINRIVLASNADGEAVAPAELASAPATTASSQSGPGEEESGQPRVRVVSEDATSIKLSVDRASEPFWLVLGQSYNKGWTAKVGGETLDAPTLVDGYANGWQVDPDGPGPMTITLEWTPQRSFEIAFVISFVATLACLGILIGAFVLRRRRRAAAPVAAVATDPLAPGAAAPPGLISSLLTAALPRRRWAMVATVGASAVASALLIRPWVGLLVGGFVLLAILSPKWRLALRLTPPLIVVGVAVYVAISQRVNKYPATFDWPTHYEAASVPTWIAVALLAADAVISMVWRSDVEPEPEPVSEPRPEQQPA